MAAEQMTKAQWLESANPFPMLQWVWSQLSDRRGRLLACAACRQIAHLLKDPRTTAALDVSERFADGAATPDELEAAVKGAVKAQNAQRRKALLFAYAAVMEAAAPWRDHLFGLGRAIGALENAVRGKVLEAEPRLGYGHLQRHRPEAFAPMAELVRDIAGNPFRPVSFAPQWRSETAVALARQMYDTRDFSAMPILADALLDAGCDNADLLAHCRGPGPHVRGCRAVDLILAKE
jgi:hypothetical protein